MDNKELVNVISQVPNVQKQVGTALQLLDKYSYIQKIHNKHQTQFMDGHFTLNHKSPYRNMRQCAAQIANRQQALIENIYKLKERRIKTKIKEEKLSEASGLKKELLQIKIEKSKTLEAISLNYIEGAVKNVLYYLKQYENIKNSLPDDSEKAVEEYEAKYFIMRLTAQSLRDIHAKGGIYTGNQEALEDIGINPRIFEGYLRKYLEDEKKLKEISVLPLEKFLEDTANRFYDCTVQILKYRGLDTEVVKDYLYLEEK